MSYPINYPTPQGANVQIFRGGDAAVSQNGTRDWVKPQGASFVWFTLVGAGGGGGGSVLESAGPTVWFGGGGASGNVTNFMCPAFLLPDTLKIKVGNGGDGGSLAIQPNDASAGTAGQPTQVFYQQKNGTGYELLIAVGGDPGTGGSYSTSGNGNGGAGQPADTGGPMTAAGFYNAIAGQSGAAGGAGTLNVNGITFVNGGIGCRYSSGVTTGYYGYTASSIRGYSQISPIIMSIAGADSDSSANTRRRASPFGCGGNGGGDLENNIATYGSRGGDGLAIIVTW